MDWLENCLPRPRRTDRIFPMAGQGMSQTQNLSQMQVLAPQLQQSLIILQAPLLELRKLIAEEMQANPTLEEETTEPEADEKAADTTANDDFKEEFEQL